jgi:hypothetical protein
MQSQIELRADQIRKWFDTQCDINNPTHRSALKRAALWLYQRQTATERESLTTHDLNGRGFNGRDANFGSRIALWKGDMTLKMAAGAKTMLRKYARQIAIVYLEAESKKERQNS